MGLGPAASPTRTWRGRMGPCRDRCGSRGTQLTPPSPAWSHSSHQHHGQTSRKIELYWGKQLCTKSNCSVAPQTVALLRPRATRGDQEGLGEQDLPACAAGGSTGLHLHCSTAPRGCSTPLWGPPHPKSPPRLGRFGLDGRKRTNLILAPSLSPTLAPSAGTDTHTCPHAQRRGASSPP